MECSDPVAFEASALSSGRIPVLVSSQGISPLVHRHANTGTSLVDSWPWPYNSGPENERRSQDAFQRLGNGFDLVPYVSNLTVNGYKSSATRMSMQPENETNGTSLEERARSASKRLESLRDGLGMTQSAVAQKLNMTRPGYSKWEDKVPDAVIVVAELAHVLNTTVEFIANGREPEISLLQAENERLRRELSEARADIRAREAIAGSDGENRNGQLARLWSVLEVVANGSGAISEEAIADTTELGLEEVKSYCVMLQRRKLIRRLDGGWAVVGIPVVRADTDEDIKAVADMAMYELEHRILPGVVRTGGAVALADVRVSGDMPGEIVMQALRDALVTVDTGEGQVLRVLVGVARV